MPRQTAAQKLAAREAAAAAAAADPPADPPAPEPEKTGPVLADYTLFGFVTATTDASYGGQAGAAWLPLGEAKVPTYTHAMDVAKDRLRDKIVAAATEEAPAPPTLKLTVAAIASRNWNQGTAIVEMRPVTTWEK